MRSDRRHPLTFIALAATASTWGAGANPKTLLEKPDAVFAAGFLEARVWAVLPLQPGREDPQLEQPAQSGPTACAAPCASPPGDCTGLASARRPAARVARLLLAPKHDPPPSTTA